MVLYFISAIAPIDEPITDNDNIFSFEGSTTEILSVLHVPLFWHCYMLYSVQRKSFGQVVASMY